MDWIRAWWRQPDHYDWLSEYLAAQGQQRPIRIFLAITVAALGCIPILAHWSPSAPRSAASVLALASASALCLVMAMMWLMRWPSRTQSRAFAIISAVCVAAACLADPDPVNGLIGCSAFAAIAGLVAFTHTSPYLVIVSGVAVATVLGCAGKIAAHGDPLGAVSKSLLVLVGILTVPAIGQVIVQMLGTGAVQSDVDALTGLHNRRGFYRTAADLVTRSRQDRNTRVSVVLADIDDFKRINDSAGHAAGDRVLIAVGMVLRRAAGKAAVTARVGGEEFLVAATVCGGGLEALAEQIRAEVAHLPQGITVSVGAACAPSSGKADILALLDQLVEVADDAMYTAKRAGGNQVVYRDLVDPGINSAR